MRWEAAGTSAAVIKTFLHATGPSVFFLQPQELVSSPLLFPSVCGKAPDILQMFTRLLVSKWLRFINRQTRCKLVLPVLTCKCKSSELSAVYLLTVWLFRSSARVKLTRRECVFGAAVWANILLLSSLTGEPWLELWGADGCLLLWLSTHHHHLSLCNAVRENYYFLRQVLPQISL